MIRRRSFLQGLGAFGAALGIPLKVFASGSEKNLETKTSIPESPLSIPTLPKTLQWTGKDQSLHQIPLDLITQNPMALRQVDHKNKLFLDLKASINQHGIINPITVRWLDGGYGLIDGMWRVEAARSLGMSTAPAIVRTVDVEPQHPVSTAELAELPLDETVPTLHVESLKSSMWSLGLLSPVMIAVQENGSLLILDGKCRVEAARRLGYTKIPCFYYKLSRKKEIQYLLSNMSNNATIRLRGNGADRNYMLLLQKELQMLELNDSNPLQFEGNKASMVKPGVQRGRTYIQPAFVHQDGTPVEGFEVPKVRVRGQRSNAVILDEYAKTDVEQTHRLMNAFSQE